ncbi:serine hydrolase domain-containing protein [Novosphingobium sp.]|uniref:serine hydrolase domain-containing protein n=1 Tax=Novosphingobium sp. TaxID=1874826 RepID=UPI0028AD1C58|nr:serine hydrolase domain-containing protein [Novosphingobium sp.]
MKPCHLIAASALALTSPAAATAPVPPASAAAQALRSELESMVAAGELPQALVLVEQNGKPLIRISTGYADVETRKPITDDAIFRLYSMSKPITSIGVLMLAEQGKLSLADPVARYLPEMADLRVWDGTARGPATTVSAERPVTIADLLLHRSGLTYEFMGDTPVQRWYREHGVARTTAVASTKVQIAPAATLGQLVERLGKAPLLHQPGARFSYGFSTTVLGAVIERASGQSLEVFLQKRILDPLEMKDTTFVLSDTQAPRLVTGYLATAKGLKAVDRPETSEYRDPERLRDGGGALAGTLEDYRHFAEMLAGGGTWHGRRLLRAETLAALYTPHLRTGGGEALDAPFGYGLAIGDAGTEARGGLPEGAGSWSGSANTYFFADPKHRVVAIVMTNELTPGPFEVRTWRLRKAVNRAALAVIRR